MGASEECGGVGAVGVHAIRMHCLYLCSYQRKQDALRKEEETNSGTERWVSSEEHLWLFFAKVQVPVLQGSSQLSGTPVPGDLCLLLTCHRHTHSPQTDVRAKHLSSKSKRNV